MPTISAVLFDLDGTLIHSLDHIVDCWQHTVRTCLGREMSREEIEPTLGRALLECFEEIAPGRSVEMREVYREYQKRTHDSAVTLVEGTRETLDGLRARDVKLGVVTSKGIHASSEGLNLFGLMPYFDTLVTYEDTERHKPHPDPLLVAISRLDLVPEVSLYVGDAEFDMRAGRAAGMQTAGVTWGAASAGVLLAAGAGYILRSMTDLLALPGLSEPASHLERAG